MIRLSFVGAIRQNAVLSDDGTLDTVIEVGNRVFRYDSQKVAQYRDDDGALDLDRFWENHADDIADEIGWELDEWFDKYSDWEREYRESHDDEGSNYAHLLREGDIRAAMQRLREYVTENWENPESIDLDQFSENFDLDLTEMQAGSIYGPDQSDGCVLESYAIGEIETEIDWSHVAETTGISREICIAWAREQDSHCVRFWRDDSDYACLYIVSDGVWYCVATDDAIQHVIDEMEGSAE